LTFYQGACSPASQSSTSLTRSATFHKRVSIRAAIAGDSLIAELLRAKLYQSV
jgi:hypothetical protein